MKNNYMLCGCSAIGKSHVDKGIKCQDNCYYDNKDNIVVAAIADGLSSSKHSDVASKIAVEHIVKYCLENMKKNDTAAIISIIRDGFDDTLLKIKTIASDAPNDYDTTLTVAALIDETLYYGQIGDSGIIALLENGKFERVTEAQNGEGIGQDKTVYPLIATSKWSFGRYDNKIKALFLVTDGVLKYIQPPLLEKQQYNLNHRYLSYVFNKIIGNNDADQWIQDEVEKIPPNEVDYDDKTLVVVINKKANLKVQPKEYYNFPTDELWRELNEKHEAKLYSYRNNEKNTSTEHSNKHNAEQIVSNKNNTALIKESLKNSTKRKSDNEVLGGQKSHEIPNTSIKKSVNKSTLTSARLSSIKKEEKWSLDFRSFFLGLLCGIIYSFVVMLIINSYIFGRF